jgi:predicted enzyme related to lactoylglutathione lyase
LSLSGIVPAETTAGGSMRTTSVTTGLPVQDLGAAQEWYARVLGHEHELEPAEGLAEFEVHPGSWLQLMEEPEGRPVFLIGVSDLEAERERLLALGIDVSPIEGIDGVIRFCDFRDPDGNELSLYQVVS